MRVLKIVLSTLFGKTYVARKCGHRTKAEGPIVAFGEKGFMSMPVTSGGVDYCINCIEGMSIRCAWCGKAITIGDPITLASPHPAQTDAMPDYAVRYDKDQSCFIGCLRWKCADSGAFRSGFWMPPGIVMRVMSPIEMAFANLSCDTATAAVVVGDVTDIREAVRVPQ